MKPLTLPWAGHDVPHVILDINRECNISCESCYTRQAFRKTRGEVAADLRAALAQRRLHTVTISGGEPTLHPELPEIVADIHQHGLHTVLLTNGVRLDHALLVRLGDAGLDALLLHIDMGQRRPDLPPHPTAAAVDALRQEVAGRVTHHGIQAGLVATLYRQSLDDLERLVDLVHRSRDLHFLLATTSWDASRFREVRGNLDDGFFASGEAAEVAAEPLSLGEIEPLLAARGMRPFGRVFSSGSAEEVRWLCYTGAVVTRRGRMRQSVSLTSGLADRGLIRLLRFLAGRYMYHVGQNETRFRCQLVLNALSGGNVAASLAALASSLVPESRLWEKRIVFQQGPSVAADGQVVHCAHCPDATIVRGQLVPICIADGWLG